MDYNVELISMLEMLVRRSLPLRNIMILIWKRQGKKKQQERPNVLEATVHEVDSYRQMC